MSELDLQVDVSWAKGPVNEGTEGDRHDASEGEWADTLRACAHHLHSFITHDYRPLDI